MCSSAFCIIMYLCLHSTSRIQLRLPTGSSEIVELRKDATLGMLRERISDVCGGCNYIPCIRGWPVQSATDNKIVIMCTTPGYGFLGSSKQLECTRCPRQYSREGHTPIICGVVKVTHLLSVGWLRSHTYYLWGGYWNPTLVSIVHLSIFTQQFRHKVQYSSSCTEVVLLW